MRALRLSVAMGSVLALVLGVAPVPLPAQGVPVIVDLGTLGGDESAAYAINNRGDVVGVSRLGAGQAAPLRAFLWTSREGMQDLGVPPGGVFSVAYDVNERRQVVGTYLVRSPEQHQRAFLWSPQDGMTDLGPGIAWSINNRGQAVGLCPVAPNEVHACLFEDGVAIALGTLGGETSTANAINNRGVVVGEGRTADGRIKAFWWTERTGMVEIAPDDAQNIAHDVNQAGVVAIDRPSGPALLVRGRFVALSLPAGSSGTVLAVNEPGLAVGGASVNGGPLRAFASRGGPAVFLGGLSSGESIAFDVNNPGMIVGRAETSAGEGRAVLWRLK